MINMKCNTLSSERKTFWSKRQDNECMRCAVLITFFHNSLNLKPDLFIMISMMILYGKSIT